MTSNAPSSGSRGTLLLDLDKLEKQICSCVRKGGVLIYWHHELNWFDFLIPQDNAQYKTRNEEHAREFQKRINCRPQSRQGLRDRQQCALSSGHEVLGWTMRCLHVALIQWVIQGCRLHALLLQVQNNTWWSVGVDAAITCHSMKTQHPLRCKFLSAGVFFSNCTNLCYL